MTAKPGLVDAFLRRFGLRPTPRGEAPVETSFSQPPPETVWPQNLPSQGAALPRGLLLPELFHPQSPRTDPPATMIRPAASHDTAALASSPDLAGLPEDYTPLQDEAPLGAEADLDGYHADDLDGDDQAAPAPPASGAQQAAGPPGSGGERKRLAYLEQLRSAPDGTGTRDANGIREAWLGLIGLGYLNDASPFADADPVLARFAGALREGEAMLPRVVTGPGKPGPDENRLTGCMLAIRPGAKRLVVAFAGDGSPAFLILPGMLEDMSSHYLFVRDPSRSAGLLGIGRLGRNQKQCLVAIDALAHLMAAPGQALPIFVTGVGAGAYGALRYGLDLGAQGVLAFAAPETLDAPRVAGRLRNFGLPLPAAYAAAPGRPGVIMVVSGKNEAERKFANQMARSPGISVRQVGDASGRRTLQAAIKSNQLDGIWTQFLALGKAEA